MSQKHLGPCQLEVVLKLPRKYDLVANVARELGNFERRFDITSNGTLFLIFLFDLFLMMSIFTFYKCKNSVETINQLTQPFSFTSSENRSMSGFLSLLQCT